MSEDWAAVAAAITDRLGELGWTQRQLAERSHVSQAIVRELQHHTVERRRSLRTLAALSSAMHWHPDHLHAVLHGHAPTHADLPSDTAETLWLRLDGIDQRLERGITQLELLTAEIRTIARHLHVQTSTP